MPAARVWIWAITTDQLTNILCDITSNPILHLWGEGASPWTAWHLVHSWHGMGGGSQHYLLSGAGWGAV